MTPSLAPDRYFAPDPAQRQLARELYRTVANLPLVCPHGHVDPRLFADPDFRFGSPTELLLIPDHYIFRMLYSQGIPLAELGIGTPLAELSEAQLRRAWQHFAEHLYLFRGTPTGIWLRDELVTLFDIDMPLNGHNAQAVYDQIDAQLKTLAFQPRALYARFNIEVLCTTDAATDTLDQHRAIRASGWPGRILPTFRPDALINLETPDWLENIETLSAVSGIDVVDYPTFIEALEQRRHFFKEMGATATDHAAPDAYTAWLPEATLEAIFQRALTGQVDPADARRFTGHMLMEMARMSLEDGLVMQLHIGSYRNHNQPLYATYGPDMGADIPLRTEFTRNLQPLLNRFGVHSELTIILFNLDESTYARELAPLAGLYPALKLGPPWWFHDSLNGMRRFFDQVTETAGLYNTVGFNDDTRAFPSIPARHDVWRRASADWVAGLQARHIVDATEAREMVHALAYGLAKASYNLA